MGTSKTGCVGLIPH